MSIRMNDNDKSALDTMVFPATCCIGEVVTEEDLTREVDEEKEDASSSQQDQQHHSEPQIVHTPPKPSSGRTTLRRVALLHTLLFVGFTLAHQKGTTVLADATTSDKAATTATGTSTTTTITTSAAEIVISESVGSSVLIQGDDDDDDDDDDNKIQQITSSGVWQDSFAVGVGGAAATTTELEPQYNNLLYSHSDNNKQRYHSFSEEEEDDDDDDEEEEEDDPNKHHAPQQHHSPPSHRNVIVLVSVDGSMAGIDKETGETLWKQTGTTSSTTTPSSSTTSSSSSSSSSSKSHTPMKPHPPPPLGTTSSSATTGTEEASLKLFFQPLVSTTTTTRSAARSSTTTTTTTSDTWRGKTAAVPSTDGHVFLTTSGSNENTITSTAKDLVARAPFVDDRGRFYVGSRSSMAVALDGNTGKVLRILPHGGGTPGTSTKNGDDDETSTDSSNPFSSSSSSVAALDDKGQNIVWIGRVDHSISIHDARTGTTDVEFSVAQVMGVADMVLDGAGSGGTTATDHVFGQPGPSSSLSSSTLVATPSGNVAYWNSETGTIQWVACESFDTPVVFAIDASTGQPLAVDIIPDAPVPDSASMDYLSRELGRQLERIHGGTTVDDDNYDDHDYDDNHKDYRNNKKRLRQEDPHDEQTTIVGALSSGQLFAMPLVQKNSRSSTSSSSSSSSTAKTKSHTTASTTSGKAQQHLPSLSSLPQIMGPTHNFYHHTNNNNKERSDGKLSDNSHGPGPDTKPQQQQQQQHSMSAKKPCTASAPAFPGCLVGSANRINTDQGNYHPFARGGGANGEFLSETAPFLLEEKQQRRGNSGGATENGGVDSQRRKYGHFTEGSMAVTTTTTPDGKYIQYHPDYGYVHPAATDGYHHYDPHAGQQHHHHHPPPPDHHHHYHPQEKKSRTNQKFLKILGSWLPPTIALIFVLSFELGRRKRQKDSRQTSQFLSTADVSLLDSTQFLRELDTAVGLLVPSHIQQHNLQQQQQQGNPLAPHHEPQQQQQQQPRAVIQVSDEILGYGGQGTVVYKGMLEGRHVAVKRLLKAYHASAEREISLLIESDGHPNVVRYFLKELRGDFVYLALELCDMSLHDLIHHLRNHATVENIAWMDQQSLHLENNNATMTGAGAIEASVTRSRKTVSPATRMILQQIASGVKHLHSLRIVHRDLKPANILLAMCNGTKTARIVANSTGGGEATKKDSQEKTVYDTFVQREYIAKISDMGLGKQLVGQSSYGGKADGASLLPGGPSKGASSVGGVGPGSVGWQAPEVMALKWQATSDSSTAGRSSDGGSFGSDYGCGKGASDPGASPKLDSPLDSIYPSPPLRTSRSVDIFSLGCIFYSTLVPGGHPFGEWYEREANIMHNRPRIDDLARLSPDAHDLVQAMIHRDPKQRPTAQQICDHPFFWISPRRLAFVCDVSDRLESDITMGSVSSPRASAVFVDNPLILERNAAAVVGTAWDKVLDDALVNNVQRYRTYDPSSVRDLLRMIRNKHHHYDELPREFRDQLAHGCQKDEIGTKSSSPKTPEEGLWDYFERRFPLLLMHCFQMCRRWLPVDDPLAAKYSITPFMVAPSPTLSTGATAATKTITIAKSQPIEREEGSPILPTSDRKVAPVVIDTGTAMDHASSRTMQTGTVSSGSGTLEKEQDRDPSGEEDGSSEAGELVSLSSGSGWEAVSEVDAATDTNAEKEIENKDLAVLCDAAAHENKLPQDSGETQMFPIVELTSTQRDSLATSVSEDASMSTTTAAAASAEPKSMNIPDDIVIWEGSTAARTLNCRGWIRSDDEWARRTDSGLRQPRNPTLVKLADDPKFRTRLCNHWDENLGTFCPMRKKNKCVFAHGPVELRVKEGKRHRWGKLVDKDGNNSNPRHSGGEDTYGAAKSIESVRKEEGKWNTKNKTAKSRTGAAGKKQQQGGGKKKQSTANQ